MITFLCLRCHWIEVPEQEFPVQFSISVSKKNFRNATQRNAIKRSVREKYRINKKILYDAVVPKSKNIAFMFVYLGKEIVPNSIIEESIQYILQKIVKKLHV